MKKVVDFNEYKLDKMKREENNKNIELFKRITTRPVKILDVDELKAYAEITPLFSIMYKDTYKIITVEFRDIIFVINYLGDGTFEYLGTFEEMFEYFIGK